MPKRTVELPIKDATLESGDYLLFVDTADTSDSPQGTDKRVQSLRIAITDGNAAQITGGGGIALGGHQVAFVKAGDVAMVDDLGGPPEAHTHLEADVTDLDKYTQAEADALLAGKSDTGHSHLISDVTGLQSALDGKEDNLSVTLSGTGSLNLGSSALTTGDKSGEIAVMADVGGGSSSSTAIVPIFHGSEYSSGATPGVTILSGGAYLPANFLDGKTMKLQVYGRGSNASQIRWHLYRGGTNVGNVSMTSSSLTMVTSGDLAGAWGTSAGRVELRMERTVAVTGYLRWAQLLIEPAT